jgi:hypothetical protein
MDDCAQKIMRSPPLKPDGVVTVYVFVPGVLGT